MTKPTKPPKMKPCRAWAILLKSGHPCAVWFGNKTDGPFRCLDGERIVRVLITEVTR